MPPPDALAGGVAPSLLSWPTEAGSSRLQPKGAGVPGSLARNGGSAEKPPAGALLAPNAQRRSSIAVMQGQHLRPGEGESMPLLLLHGIVAPPLK